MRRIAGFSASLLVRTRVYPASIACAIDWYFSARAMPRPRVGGRGHAANYGTVEHRAADDLIALASDPEAIMADGWILEPVAPPFVERHLAFGHRARHIVRRLEHGLVQLSVPLRV